MTVSVPGQVVASPEGPLPASAQAASPTPSPEATLRRLRQEIDTGHPDRALAEIEALRQHPPAPSGLSRVEGLALYSQGDLRKADAAFASALEQDPQDTEAAQMRGLTLFRLGRPAEAIPLLEASRGFDKGKADPNYILGLCYMDTRRYDDARHALAAQYGFAPESAPAYLIAARMLFRREFVPVARASAEKALTLEPTLPLAHELLGEIALAGNHLDDAIAQFEQEKQHNPLEGVLYDRLGDAYLRATRYDDAERNLQEAVLLEPSSTAPYILLGKTLLKKTDPVGAATYLERASQMDPANSMTHSLLAQAYRDMGRADDAAHENETAQKLRAATEPRLQDAH